MEQCEFTPRCPIFRKFRHEGIKNVWLKAYCLRSKGAQCKRKELRLGGAKPEEIPHTMLPNGGFLDSLEFSDRSFGNWTDNDCEYREACVPMFNRFQEADTKDFWAVRFCFRDKGRACYRKGLISGGTDPALISNDCLPNGQHF